MFARMRSSRGANVLGELLMLVVGINIALWFEGKFEDFRDAETEQLYLQGLHDDLTKDRDSLERRINGNKGKIERLGSIVGMLPGLAEIPPEELVGVMFEPSSYDFFQPSDFTYRSMQDSGDFRLLSDSELKKNLLRLIRLYRMIDQRQQNFIQALDDSYIPLMMGSFDIATMKLTDPTIADNQTFRNFFPFALQDIQDRVAAYEAARKQVEILLSQIAAQSDPA
ncbi:MAG: hypothetical protein PVG76_04210 [Chromatiales bacterium]